MTVSPSTTRSRTAGVPAALAGDGAPDGAGDAEGAAAGRSVGSVVMTMVWHPVRTGVSRISSAVTLYRASRAPGRDAGLGPRVTRSTVARDCTGPARTRKAAGAARLWRRNN